MCAVRRIHRPTPITIAVTSQLRSHSHRTPPQLLLLLRLLPVPAGPAATCMSARPVVLPFLLLLHELLLLQGG